VLNKHTNKPQDQFTNIFRLAKLLSDSITGG